MKDRQRCAVCGMRMHRYGFGPDLDPADIDNHQPTAVACVNGIIADLEIVLDDYVPQRISRTLTSIAFVLDKEIDKRRNVDALLTRLAEAEAERDHAEELREINFEMVKDLNERNVAQSAENTRLREALAPFTKLEADGWMDDVTIARAALAKTADPEAEDETAWNAAVSLGQRCVNGVHVTGCSRNHDFPEVDSLRKDEG